MDKNNYYNEIIKMAIDVRNYSYSPYSGFKVGACLRDKEGNLFTGCNIENAAFSPTNFSEITAFCMSSSPQNTPSTLHQTGLLHS